MKPMSSGSADPSANPIASKQATSLQALLDEAAVGRLSRDRDPNLLARCGDVEADVDQLAEAGRDIAISMGEGVGEDGGDQVDGVIDDARVALKLVTKSVIDIERETYPAARSLPCRSSCWRRQTTDK